MEYGLSDPFTSKSINPREHGILEQLYAQAPFGMFTLDREMRFVRVNDQMASLFGIAASQIIGTTLTNAIQGIGSILVPILLHVLNEGRPLADLTIDIPGSGPAHTCYWLLNCYPLRSNEGEISGLGVVVQDITEKKAKEASQNDRLRFESLLSDLSLDFINVPVSEVDSKIESCLKKLVEFLGFDRISVWHFFSDLARLYCSYSLPEIKLPPPVLDDVVPTWVAMARKGEMFYISDTNELPDNQWRERKYCKEQGNFKSILFIPLSVGGTALGAVSFVSYSVNVLWPDIIIQRLRLLGGIFANALERKKADQKIQKAFCEIELLKDRLVAENHYLRDQIVIEHRHEEIVGQSEGIRKALLQAGQVACTDSTVLILGETGTGKELIARAIHNLSPRKDRVMIKINCAALPANLIESELFGREKGAYTGAQSQQIGRFESADGSTLFLDEIGELPLELQAKLLRVLQEAQFERLGSSKPINVNVRIIAATNRDLAQAVKNGTFREDLYYRLNVFPISVPPLRERREDIQPLVWALVKEFSSTFGKTIEVIPRKTMDALKNHSWPGNVRELRNMVERAMILNNCPTLVIDIPNTDSPTLHSPTLHSTSLKDTERMHILGILKSVGWRVRGKFGAAELLHLKPTTLESKMKKLGIKRCHSASEI